MPVLIGRDGDPFKLPRYYAGILERRRGELRGEHPGVQVTRQKVEDLGMQRLPCFLAFVVVKLLELHGKPMPIDHELGVGTPMVSSCNQLNLMPGKLRGSTVP